MSGHTAFFSSNLTGWSVIGCVPYVIILIPYPKIGGCVSLDHRNYPPTGLHDVNAFMLLVTWSEAPKSRMMLSHSSHSVGVVYAALSADLGRFITT
jgi:hypothetical protein